MTTPTTGTVQPLKPGTLLVRFHHCALCGLEVHAPWREPSERRPLTRRRRGRPFSRDAKRRAAHPFRCPTHGRLRADQVEPRARPIRLVAWEESDFYDTVIVAKNAQ